MADIVIAGAEYHGVPSIQVPKVGGGMAEFTEGGGSPVLKFGVLRPDAELMKTYSYDKYIVADEGVDIPAYTTTSKTLLATAALEETYTVSYADYNWYILERCLTIPEYSVTTKAKGRAEWHMTMVAYELTEIPANTLHALITPSTYYTSRTVTLNSVSAFSRLVYWSSGTAVSAYSTAAYGTVQACVAPTLASGVITFNTPNFIVRGSTSYFTSTYMNALTDIRYQWVFEVYRAPKNNLNLDGWGQFTQAMHVVDCVNSPDHKLT